MPRQRDDAVLTDYYRESKEYFERRYDGIRWDSHPRIDHSSRDNETGEIYASLGVEETQILAAEQAYHVSRNELFIAVAALAIAIYNDSSDILLTWIYNGRNDMLMMSSVGLLYRDLPVGLRFNDRISIREICADVKDQVRKGIEYSCYPYVELKDQVGESESACLLYQQDMRGEGSLEGFNVDLIDVKHNQAASQTILDIQILDDSSGPKLMIDYSASRYLESSIDKFKDLFTKITQEIASHLAGADLTVGEIRSKVSENGFASVDKREEQD